MNEMEQTPNLVPSANREKTPPTRTFHSIDYDSEVWSEIKNNEYYQLDIRYATDNNFMNQKIYPCGRCFLDIQTKKMLENAAKDFHKLGYKILLYDCYRPKPMQQKLWDIKPNASYVTPPWKGSMHNRGSAVDMGLILLDGSPVDMGTEYDFFGPRAHYTFSELSETVTNNRKLLRSTMEKSGFTGIRTEWWHFSYKESPSPISDWVWLCEN